MQLRKALRLRVPNTPVHVAGVFFAAGPLCASYRSTSVGALPWLGRFRWALRDDVGPV